MHHDHSYYLFTLYIWVLFFVHIPFIVNRTFNATSMEKLQHCMNMLLSLPQLLRVNYFANFVTA